MITNRSYHIPMFTNTEMMKNAFRFWRIFLIHSSCGTMALKVIIDHPAHQ
jgi:hypothetical protein